jgi:3'(2'), 5'-bisphosphate nucleotidase
VLDINAPTIRFALHATRQAALLARQVQAELAVEALAKDDRSPVTVADFAAQALVSQLLATLLPGEQLIAEEAAQALRRPEQAGRLAQVTDFVARFLPEATPERVCEWIDRGVGEPGPRFWVLDPVDGTKGFLRGGQYVAALALVEAGQVQVGVLGCPNLTDGYRPELEGPGSLVVAVRGQGAWTTSLSAPVDFDRLRVSTRRDPAQARLLRSFEAGHTNVALLDQVAERLHIQAEPVRMDSQAKYAILAAGKGDLSVRLLSPEQPDYREKIWDQAPGALVIEEAGGRISDLDGKPLDFTAGRWLRHNRGVLVSNGHLHQAALAALHAVGA